MDRAEEVWRDAFGEWATQPDKTIADQAATAVIRTAMEAYAAEKVAEERAAIVAWLRAHVHEVASDNAYWGGPHTRREMDASEIIKAIAANQHHGGNDG